MRPVERFLVHYFRERTGLCQAEVERRSAHRQNFFASDCDWDSRQGEVEGSQAETIVSVSNTDDETLVITTGLHSHEKFPLRYHLRPKGDSWLIHDVEFQCLHCHGTGRARSGDIRSGHCQICGGKGWQNVT